MRLKRCYLYFGDKHYVGPGLVFLLRIPRKFQFVVHGFLLENLERALQEDIAA